MHDIVIRNPSKIVNNFLSSDRGKKIKDLAAHLSLVITQRHSVSSIPGEWSKRVFIGGGYSRIGLLAQIKKIVKDKGYEPIIALEFVIDEDLIHRHSLLLLHSCKYAIFDVSTRDGQLMEIERTFDYSIKSLFVFELGIQKKPSMMIQSFGIDIENFSTANQLEKLIQAYLP